MANCSPACCRTTAFCQPSFYGLRGYSRTIVTISDTPFSLACGNFLCHVAMRNYFCWWSSLLFDAPLDMKPSWWLSSALLHWPLLPFSRRQGGLQHRPCCFPPHFLRGDIRIKEKENSIIIIAYSRHCRGWLHELWPCMQHVLTKTIILRSKRFFPHKTKCWGLIW